jgi:hypothetical protein
VDAKGNHSSTITRSTLDGKIYFLQSETILPTGPPNLAS